MTIEGVDFSGARPGGAALVAAGKHFVGRYLTGAGKALTKAEVADYRAHGLAIFVVFESTANRALSGRAAGQTDARAAVAAMAALGMPTRPIYFAVDFNATVAQQPAIDAYLGGAASVIGLAWVGAYGGGYFLARCRAHGTATWFWQCASTSWGPLQSFVHIWQYKTDGMGAPHINGGKVDDNRAMKADYGQWAPGAPTGGTDMPTLSSYIPGQVAVVKKTANVRTDAKLTASIIRVVGATGAATESWAVTGWVTGDVDPDGGSNQWITRWNAGKWEFTAKSNLTSGPTAPAVSAPTDCKPAVATAVAPLNAQIGTLKTSLQQAEDGRVAALAKADAATAAEKGRIAAAEAARIKAI